jgi:NAD(P)-dependent dehydrogenase (short-subunit alcohol dehydrogenase family)
MASYSVSKAALIGLTHQMAADYGPRGIRVNAVAPGLIDTPLVHDRIGPGTRVHALMVQTTPFPRIGRPQDIADAVQFLLSDKAAFINGHVLAVDGGWSVTNWVAGAPPE